MPQVTGTVTRPDGTPAVGATVKPKLSGSAYAFNTASGETVLASQAPVQVDEATGAFTIDLPGNTVLEPDGTQWTLEVTGSGVAPFRTTIIVPATGGPYAVRDLLADPLPALPALGAITEVDYAEILTPNDPVAINTLGITAVANMIVTVPDLTEPCYILGSIGVKHSVLDANVAVAIGPAGLASGEIALVKGAGWAHVGAIGTVSTIPCRARIAPHSPGDYQAYLNGTVGNVTVEAQPFAPASLAAWRVAVAA